MNRRYLKILLRLLRHARRLFHHHVFVVVEKTLFTDRNIVEEKLKVFRRLPDDEAR